MTKKLSEECTSLEETPRGGLEYTVVVKADIPWRKLRNAVYWLTPSFSPERAHERREEIIRQYGLNNSEVIVYTRPSSSFPRS